MKVHNRMKVIHELPRQSFKNNTYLRLTQEPSIPPSTESEKDSCYTEEGNSQGYRENEKIKEETSKPPTSIMSVPSHFDIFDERSLVSSSDFCGFFNLILNVGLFFSVTVPILHYLDKGVLVDLSLLLSILEKFPIFILLWLHNFAFSFSTYFLYWLYRNKNLSKRALIVLEIISQVWVLVFTIFNCLNIRFPAVLCGFLVSIGYVFFMKMHSYVFVNLESEQKEPKEYLKWSQNMNMKDYMLFLACPSIVYKHNFKRIDKFRSKYFIEKLTHMFLTMIILYITYSNYILPVVKEMPRASIFVTFLRFIFPCFIIFLASFYLIFECLCNIFAEITRFGERTFYEDWWNSTVWSDFSRKWNHIVQVWLYQHIYLVAKNNYKLDKFRACVVTYFISAMFHEVLLMVCFRSCKFSLFFLMFLQFPLSWLGEYFYKNKSMGNIIFWSNIIMGMPLIFISYAYGINN